MNSVNFGNFHVGMVEDPSTEALGGFEFASGMDIFSELGVIKACQAMKAVTLNGGVTLDALPQDIDISADTAFEAFVAAGAKILKAHDNTGDSWDLLITNANGANVNLRAWNGKVVYATQAKLGTVNYDGSVQTDTVATLNTEDYHPMIPQGGTLKIGNGRYVGSMDESFVWTDQVLKLPVGYVIKTLAEHLQKLFVGTIFGSIGSGITIEDASVFDWRGVILSSGSALPDTPYGVKKRAMNALYSDGVSLFGFPGVQGDTYGFDGANFNPLLRIATKAINSATFKVAPAGVTKHSDDTLLFGGDMTDQAGVFQVRDFGNNVRAICQAFVPASSTPGGSGQYTIGFVKSGFQGRVLIGYEKLADGTFHIDITDTANKQNGALIRTVWHRIGITSSHSKRSFAGHLKRWSGVKLNMKPLASGCSVAVAYRTSRDGAFTDSGYTITSANQDKPVILAAQPRSTEIQFKFTFTTNGNNTPELESYDVLFDILKSTR